ncbi:hypothetical protein CWO91_36820 [Bradyrhizobium genosp. SA-3]|uniref:hypothetical protein n=1 Tax=Bradyrhizobium genosp. SA-3 TaxID=508868 RepID=UPI001029D1C5|nr:hypothetical protein [Bradyrhizobium genosp. SA-3]RZM98714.1 hypothetical protein CWO91_36820 [Bradyrhizobium genosp. SA-3]
MTESLFQNWCTLNGVQPVPVAPHVVARFIADITPLGIDKVWPAVQEISRTHYTVGLADPTLGHPVATLVTEIGAVEPPRSWDKEHKLRFKSLPYDLQLYIAAKEAQREVTMRRVFSERDNLKNELKAIKEAA